MSFADEIQSARGKRLAFRVDIQGISAPFTSHLPGAPVGDVFDGRGLLISVDESQTRLDIHRFRQVGGGLLIKLLDTPTNGLRNLFAPRVSPAYFVRFTAAPTDAVISVGGTSSITPTSGRVWIGDETIIYTGVTGGAGTATLTGCTRGADGTIARSHKGTSTSGVGIYTRPPTYFGRRVTLTGLWLDSDGVPIAGAEQVLGVYRLTESPVTDGKGVWEFRCSHLSDELGQRKLGSGLREYPGEGLTWEYVTPSSLSSRIVIRRTRDQPSFLRYFGAGVDGADGLVFPVVVVVEFAAMGGVTTAHRAVDVTADELVLESAPLVGSAQSMLDQAALVDSLRGTNDGSSMATADRLESAFGLEGRAITSLRAMAVLDQRRARVAMLQALTSRLGLLENGAFDALPGIESSTFDGEEYRYGADYRAAEIDDAAIDSLSAVIRPGWSWVIDQEQPLSDLLESFGRHTRHSWVFNRDGLLTLRNMMLTRNPSLSVGQNTNVKGEITSSLLEQETYARAEIKSNYDFISGEYKASVAILDREIARLYPQAQRRLIIEDKGLTIEPQGRDGPVLIRPSISYEEIVPLLRRDMSSNRGGPLTVTMRLDMSALLLELGQVVDLDLPSVGDYRGGVLTGVVGRVIAIRPIYDGADAGTVEVELLVEDRTLHFSPVFYVTSNVVNSATSVTVTTTAAAAHFGQTATAARRFRAGDMVAVYNRATGVTVGLGADQVFVDSIDGDNVMTLLRDTPDVPPIVNGASTIFVRASLQSSAQSVDGFRLVDYPLMETITSRWK